MSSKGNENSPGEDASDASEVSQSESSESQNEEDTYSWIPWFVSLKGNEFFTVVDTEFIQDSFNLTGLSGFVPYYDQALDMILDMEQDEALSEELQNSIENEAENLYGLIHARFLLTSRGLSAMAEKFKSGDFGKCPRVFCRSAHLLPVGLSDLPKRDSVKLFCSSCNEIYHPRSSRHEHIDGAFFGASFAHLFFMVFPELRATPSQEPSHYVPRVFGFKIHASSHHKCMEARQRQLQQQQQQQVEDQQRIAQLQQQPLQPGARK